MAYAFNSIDDLLGDKQQQNQNNIFGEGQAATVQPQQQPQGAQVQTKTSTEGDLGNANSSSSSTSSGGQQAAPTGVPSNQSDRAAFKANAGKTAKPKVFEDIGSTLSANQAAAQQEANAYTRNATTGYQSAYGTNAGDVRGAVAGDEKATNKVRNILGTQTVSEPKEFAFSKDYSSPDAAMLSTDAGLRSLVSRGQDANYTPGMAAFDLGALRKSGDFQNNVRDLQTKSTDLNKQLGDYVSELPQNVRKIGENLLQSSRAGITGGLENYRANLDKQNKQELAAKNAELERLRKSGVPLEAFAEISKLLPGAQAKANQLDEGAGAFVNPGRIDPRDFATFRDNYTDKDVIDAGEASQYNNIMSLLGLGGPAYEAAGPLAPVYSLDKTGIENELVKAAVGANKAKKTKEQAKKDQQIALENAAIQLQNEQTQREEDQRRRQEELAKMYKDFGRDVPGAATVSNSQVRAAPNDLLAAMKRGGFRALSGSLGGSEIR